MSRDLLRYPLFNLLSPAALEGWWAAGQEASFATGETIFQEGSRGEWAYLVLDGRVRVLKRSAKGREVPLGALNPGELFGEYALLPPHQNTATCRAAAPTELVRLPLAALARLLQPVQGLRRNLKNWLRLHGLAAHLRGRTFLGFLSAPSALKFLDRLEADSFRPLRALQADGLRDDRWHFIQSGQVLLTADSSGERGRSLGPGDTFGETALAGGGGLLVAFALNEVHCLSLPRAAFDPAFTAAGGGRGVSLYSAVQTDVRSREGPRQYPWVGQREESDCGVASLAMIARFHGRDVTLEQLRGRVAVGPRGATLMELQRAGAGLGLSCLAVRIDPQQLGQVALPAVVHLKSQHYVVLYEMAQGSVVVGDPATGVVRLNLVTFAATCSASLLLVRPGERTR
jgi:CRP-like cAMP-binding protein/predicted double-glycine peptidase